MPKIIKNGKEYSGVPLETLTAWPDTGDRADVAQPLMGNTSLAGIGDGTVTGAAKALDTDMKYRIGSFKEFYYSAIAGSSDAAVIGTALDDILSNMTAGAFVTRIMRSGAWLLVGYGAVRASKAFAQVFNTNDGTIYVVEKQIGIATVVKKTL